MRLAGGQTHNGIRHAKGCACALCDPKQTRAAAARAAALAAAHLPVTPAVTGAPSPAPPRPRHGPREADGRTIRFRALLHAGVRSSDALEIVEREFANQTGEKRP